MTPTTTILLPPAHHASSSVGPDTLTETTTSSWLPFHSSRRLPRLHRLRRLREGKKMTKNGKTKNKKKAGKTDHTASRYPTTSTQLRTRCALPSGSAGIQRVGLVRGEVRARGRGVRRRSGDGGANTIELGRTSGIYEWDDCEHVL